MSKQLVLFEEAPTDWEPASGDVVVALTPRACVELERRGVAYRIPFDFGAEEFLRKQEGSYLQEQLSWLELLNDLIRRHIPELQSLAVPPAFLYGYPLKLLLDNHFTRGTECALLLEDRYDRVTLWTDHDSADAQNQFFATCLRQRHVTARLLSLLCGCRGVPLVTKSVTPGNLKAVGYLAVARSLKASLHSIGWQVRGRIHSRQASGWRLTLLFLETQYDLNDLLKSSLQAGHRCLILDRAGIRDLSAGGRTVLQVSAGMGDGLQKQPWDALAQELFSPSSPLWDWPRRWWDCPVDKVLAKPLRAWVQQELPEFLGLSEHFRRFYDAADVDFVITPAISSTVHAAALSACRPGAGIQSVLIAHGDGPDEKPAWDLFELFPSQHYFVPDSEFADYFRERRLLYRFPVARVHVGSYRWNRFTVVRQEPSVSPNSLSVPRGRAVVVYPCCQPELDVRYLNTLGYSAPWYHRLQVRLIETLCEFSSTTIVVKLFPGDEKKTSAVARAVARMGKRNIRISSVPFARWLPWASRVILDFPSTPLYETALAGVPFHLLIRQDLPMRPAALERFQGCFTVFRDVEEAAEAVRRYMARPHTGTPAIKPEGKEILTSLTELWQGAPQGETALEVPLGVRS